VIRVGVITEREECLLTKPTFATGDVERNNHSVTFQERSLILRLFYHHAE
jgi:hypothetical protein